MLVHLFVRPDAPVLCFWCQAKHVGLLLAVLFAWAMEQVLWVHTGDSNDACYEFFFDTRRWSNLVTVGVAAAVVAAVTYGEWNTVKVLAERPGG